MPCVVILFANDHHLGDAHGHIEAVLVLNEHDILPLEAGHTSTADFTQKSYFIAYFHNKPSRITFSTSILFLSFKSSDS